MTDHLLVPGQHPNPSSLAPRGCADRDPTESSFANYRRLEQASRPGYLEPLKRVKHDAHAVAIGCSITASYYLEEGFSWPRIIESLNRMPMNVCAFSASSLMMQTFAFVDLLTQVKRPLHVYMLIPDLERFWGPSMAAPVNSQSTTNYMWLPELQTYIRPNEFSVFFDTATGTEKKGNKTIKAATHTDYKGHKFMFPVELGIQQSLIALEMLLNTCTIIRANKYLFSWSGRAQTHLDKINPDGLVNNFLTSGANAPRYSDNTTPECTRHKPMTVGQRRVWNVAHDKWHPGLHEHIHFAEAFMSREISNEEIDGLTP